MSKKTKRLKIYRVHHLPGAELPDPVEFGVLQSLQEFDEKGNIILEIAYTHDGEIGDKNEFRYDDNGRLIESIVYGEDQEILERSEITRDKDGRILTETVHYLDGSADRRSFYYDDNGYLTSIVTTDEDEQPEFSERYTYDSGKLVRIERRNEENEIIFIQEDTYEDGVIRGRKLWSSEAEEPFTLVTDYDEMGHRVKETRFDSRERLIERNIYEVDANGRTVKTVEENRQRKNTTEISYDAAGNVTYQRETDLNGDLNHEIFRSYDEQGNPTMVTVEAIQKNSGEKRAYSLIYLYEADAE